MDVSVGETIRALRGKARYAVIIKDIVFQGPVHAENMDFMFATVVATKRGIRSARKRLDFLCRKKLAVVNGDLASLGIVDFFSPISKKDRETFVIPSRYSVSGIEVYCVETVTEALELFAFNGDIAIIEYFMQYYPIPDDQKTPRFFRKLAWEVSSRAQENGVSLEDHVQFIQTMFEKTATLIGPSRKKQATEGLAFVDSLEGKGMIPLPFYERDGRVYLGRFARWIRIMTDSEAPEDADGESISLKEVMAAGTCEIPMTVLTDVTGHYRFATVKTLFFESLRSTRFTEKFRDFPLIKKFFDIYRDPGNFVFYFPKE